MIISNSNSSRHHRINNSEYQRLINTCRIIEDELAALMKERQSAMNDKRTTDEIIQEINEEIADAKEELLDVLQDLKRFR